MCLRDPFLGRQKVAPGRLQNQRLMFQSKTPVCLPYLSNMLCCNYSQFMCYFSLNSCTLCLKKDMCLILLTISVCFKYLHLWHLLKHTLSVHTYRQLQLCHQCTLPLCMWGRRVCQSSIARILSQTGQVWKYQSSTLLCGRLKECSEFHRLHWTTSCDASILPVH